MYETADHIIALFDHGLPGRSSNCECEQHYLDCGPSKQDFSDHNIRGTAEIEMNVRLLESFLINKDCDSGGKTNYYNSFMDLSVADQRKVWQNSCFHYGAYGYNEDDSNRFWQKREKASQKKP